MKTTTQTARRLSVAGLAAGLCLGPAPPARAQTNDTMLAGENKPAAEFKPLAPGEYNNWLTLSAGNYFVEGDKAQFQQRHQQHAGLFGGIEELHLEQPIQKRGLLTVDGRAIFENHDYMLKLGASYPDLGYVQAGYRQFRTWYDGSGGFFPPNGLWFELYDDQMAIDRGEAWFEAGLRLPEIPEITFRYSHQFRDGKKDSTSWGDTGLTGGLGVRGLVPSFWDIDERRDLFELDIKHTIGNTDVGLGGRVDLLHQNNSRNERRRPGETGTTVLGPNTSIDRFVTQRDVLEAEMFNVHGFTDSRLSEKVRFTVGGSFTTMDTDISGSRIYGPDYDSVYDPSFERRQQRDEGFFDLTGGALWKQYVGNVNLMWTPQDDLALVPSVRFEHSTQHGTASFTETEVLAGPTFITSEENLFNEQSRRFTDVTEALELRYTGVTNWVFYARGEWLEGQGNQTESQANDDLPFPSTTIMRDTDSRRFTQKYALGINWYPRSVVNFASQYYHKQRENDYTHNLDSTTNAPPSGDRYPAFLVAQDFRTDDVNFRITWRPCRFFSSVSRYDFQLSTIDTQGDQLSSVESGRMTSHIFSQNLTFSPWDRIYIQGSGSYVFDELNTPATSATGAAANLVTKSQNGFWNASALVGIALDDRTDLQLQYSYFQSDDYTDNSAFSTAYGDKAREHGATVTFSRMLMRHLRWTVKYGYYNFRDIASGGHNNYTAHMAYSGVQFLF